MDVSIIAIGSELLGTNRLDTNSLHITRLLERYGAGLVRKAVVPDDIRTIGAELRFALSMCDAAIVTGGLGPTEDDVTKEAVADAFSLTLVNEPSVLHRIEERFETRGLKMPPVNARQARVFAGQRMLTNDRGTAPGFHLNVTLEGRPKHLWLFPGVPYELDGLLEGELEPWLKTQQGQQSRFRRIVKLTGLTESAAEQELEEFYREFKDDDITILAAEGEIEIHLQADGTPDDAYPRLTAMEERLRSIFGERVFGLDYEELEAVVGRFLASRGETVATAESCTGGLLGSRITDVPGSSAYYLGGGITYSRQAKLFLLGVDPASIEKHGEVSEVIATQMAQGIRRRFNTTYGVGITGIAGPTGGTKKKPVGTVHIAVATLTDTLHYRFRFSGSRELIKAQAAQGALNLLRLMITRSARN